MPNAYEPDPLLGGRQLSRPIRRLYPVELFGSKASGGDAGPPQAADNFCLGLSRSTFEFRDMEGPPNVAALVGYGAVRPYARSLPIVRREHNQVSQPPAPGG
jgi:hypothetical protein